MDKLAAINVSDVACLRGGRVLFRGLSFDVAAGQALALEGPNGAGKSSLLRMIAGFLAPVAGKISLNTDKGAVEDGELRGRFVGFLGHHDAAKAQLTVEEQLKFYAQLYGAQGDIAAALTLAGLTRLAGLPCQYLSAGQKKRLALARLSLIARPLWLLDEPLAALDSAGKALAASLIAAHCNGGGIAIVATHEPLGLDATRLELAAS